MLREVGFKNSAYYNGPYRASKLSEPLIPLFKDHAQIKNIELLAGSIFLVFSPVKIEEYSTGKLRIFLN